MDNQDRVKKIQQASLNRLRQDISRVKRQTDSAQRTRSVFLSELMLTRLEQGLTQAQLAQRSGLQQAAIARIESGKTSPTLDSLIKLARALNRDLVLE